MAVKTLPEPHNELLRRIYDADKGHPSTLHDFKDLMADYPEDFRSPGTTRRSKTCRNSATCTRRPARPSAGRSADCPPEGGATSKGFHLERTSRSWWRRLHGRATTITSGLRAER